MTALRVVIAGGGIGGISAALCLASKGCAVEVLEQAEGFTEAGAGIQLSPNCSRILHALGLESALRAVAFLPAGTQFRHWRHGRVISENALGDDAVARYGAPYYHIHRGDLLALLVAAARNSPYVSLVADCRVQGFTQQNNGVTVATSQGERVADLLIGADGIHSTVREALWGAAEPRFTGNVAWRALVPARALPADLIRPMSTAWWGPGKHFVHYYVRGGELVNCVCVVEKEGWTLESWTEPGDVQELRHDFAGWHDDIQQLLANVAPDSLYKWALFDREPMPHWSQGCVTLLGDACHPTLPFMAQGAAMAIEDGAVLARCITLGDKPSAQLPAQLLRYERLRRPRTARIQNGSRRNARVFHMSGVPAWLRNRAARTAGNRAMDGLFSYDALQEENE
ncbi:MAG: FAD-dependent monooxygenase [Pseudomonadales bacterium]